MYVSSDEGEESFAHLSGPADSTAGDEMCPGAPVLQDPMNGLAFAGKSLIQASAPEPMAADSVSEYQDIPGASLIQKTRRSSAQDLEAVDDLSELEACATTSLSQAGRSLMQTSFQDMESTDSVTESKVCRGAAMLQASLHKSPVKSMPVAGASFSDLLQSAGIQGFGRRLPEFLIVVACFVALAWGYFFLCSRHAAQVADKMQKQKPRPAPPPPVPETTVEDEESTDDEPMLDAHPLAGRGLLSESHLAQSGTLSSTLAHLAYKAESDAGDWQVGGLADFEKEPSEYDENAVPKYLESRFSSFRLLLQIVGTLAQFWMALAFMYWSLLNRKEELMDCEGFRGSAQCTGKCSFVVHSCHYTRACLSGFPILAANTVLVLMIRTLMQTRLYYSMLRSGYVVVFRSVPVVRSWWPWFIGLSMLQGGLHFALKATYEQDTFEWFVFPLLVRKFVLPGSIFFSLLFRYADVENVLVPLNHIAELDVTTTQRSSPWLAKVSVMNERVLAFDARHRDVYSDTLSNVARQPTLGDILDNIIANYESAHEVWSTQIHSPWGLFRSMWPAAILLDNRLDRRDKDTDSWFMVSRILLIGSMVTSVLSLYIFLGLTSDDAWNLLGANIKAVFTRSTVSNTAITLGNLVTIAHAVAVFALFLNTVRNMFYFTIKGFEVETSAAVDQAASAAARTFTPMAFRRSASRLPADSGN